MAVDAFPMKSSFILYLPSSQDDAILAHGIFEPQTPSSEWHTLCLTMAAEDRGYSSVDTLVWEV